MTIKVQHIIPLFFLFLFAKEVVGQSDSTRVILKFDETDSYLVINQDYSNCIPVNPNDEVVIESGKKILTIASKYHYDAVVNPTFRPGVTHTIMFSQREIKNLQKNAYQSSYAACKLKSNVFVFADHDASVNIEGQDLRKSSFRTTLENGSYRIITTVDGVSEVSEMTVNGYTVFRNYVRPTRFELFKKSFIPGTAQFRKHEKLKGTLFISMLGGLTVSTIFSNFKLRQEKSDYEELRLEYQFATDPEEILTIADKADKTYDKILRLERIRNASIIAFSATYLLNILDGVTAPEFGLRKEKFKIKPFIDFDTHLIPKAKIEIDF